MIYVFVGAGFEEIEAITAVDILRRAELDVKTVGVGSKTVVGAHGIAIVCDLTLEQSSPEDLQMIVLPGGMPGTLSLEHSPDVCGYIDFAVQNSIPIGAICAAPSILGHRGALNGRRATCYPGFEDQLIGCDYTGSELEIDGDIITADGPASAQKFALALVAKLLGQERADILEASL